MELARRPRFAEVSPSAGAFDQSAFDRVLEEDPDEALSLLAELAGATDARLRELARRLAGRVVVQIARGGRSRTSGVGRIQVTALSEGSDIDFDASSDALLHASASRRPVDMTDLRGRSWSRPTATISLLVDRSGSMGGRKLATAAVAAAAVAFRAGRDYSVLAFGEDVVVIKAQDEDRPVDAVVDDLLALRGHGTTNLALALNEATVQLARSSARERAVVLMSDGRATSGPDPLGAARAIERLAILAPRGDSEDAAALAQAVGARLTEVAGPSGIPAAMATLLGR